MHVVPKVLEHMTITYLYYRNMAFKPSPEVNCFKYSCCGAECPVVVVATVVHVAPNVLNHITIEKHYSRTLMKI